MWGASRLHVKKQNIACRASNSVNTQTRHSHLFVTGVNLAVMTVLSSEPKPDCLRVQIRATLLERSLQMSFCFKQHHQQQQRRHANRTAFTARVKPNHVGQWHYVNVPTFNKLPGDFEIRCASRVRSLHKRKARVR